MSSTTRIKTKVLSRECNFKLRDVMQFYELRYRVRQSYMNYKFTSSISLKNVPRSTSLNFNSSGVNFKPSMSLNHLCKMLLDISFQSSTKTDAVSRSCFVKKGFLKISQNWQENTCARVSFLIKLQAWGLKLY